MDKKVLADVYSKLKSARETVAGCDYQDLPVTIEKVKEALNSMTTAFSEARFNAKDCGTLLGWVNRTILAKGILERAKEYGDRLEPDRILCDVLNEMLKVLD